MKVVEAISSSFDYYPFLLAWHALIRYPIYCMIIQVWIHYQAFWLFYKGVAFQPHPNGTETAASRIIGSIMKPFFALQEMLHVAPKCNAQEDGSKKSD
jgi:hypothetical protein